MGTDIHMRAEIFKNNRWQVVGAVFPADRLNPDSREYELDPDRKSVEPYNWRNYHLFAILADVRNGWGVAGVPTGTEFNPIAEPRGLPEDLSDELRESDCDRAEGAYWLGDHSYSWLTLKELLDYDWDQQMLLIGVRGEQEYHRWKAGERTSFCAGVWGRNIVTLNETDYLALTEKAPDVEYFIRSAWPMSYRDCVGSWWFDHTLPALTDLVAETQDHSTEQVRIVFGFDS